LDSDARRSFPRSRRLLSPADFRWVFDRALRSSDAAFTILARARADSGTQPRLGLAISRKCARRAVARNRIKRLVRESFRQRGVNLPGCDFVVMCRPAAAALDNPALRASLERHWTRLTRTCARS
jgi:ribonuclease P protein component